MPIVKANDIDVCYETTGDGEGMPLLLVHGYGAQLIQWPEGFCEELAARGFFVIRYDNRDVGLSQKFHGQMPVLGPPDPGSSFLTLAEPPPYTLVDMARDGLGVLDVLGIERAHVAGASLGGCAVQRMAIDFPDRVLSLTSIMSTTGNPDVGGPTPEAAVAVFAPMPPERDAYIDHLVKVTKVFYGPLYDEKAVREMAVRRYDRAYYPEGMARQLAALIADGDRTEGLKKVSVPTLVIHGRADTLARLSGGEATAAAVPGAELLVLDEMGHDLPAKLWPQLADAIARNAARASAGADRG